MARKNRDDFWQEWRHDRRVSYSLSDGGLKVMVIDKELGFKTSTWVRLIGGSIDSTVRPLASDLGLQIRWPD